MNKKIGVIGLTVIILVGLCAFSTAGPFDCLGTACQLAGCGCDPDFCSFGKYWMFCCCCGSVYGCQVLCACVPNGTDCDDYSFWENC